MVRDPMNKLMDGVLVIYFVFQLSRRPRRAQRNARVRIHSWTNSVRITESNSI